MCKLEETWLEKFVKSLQVNLFLEGFGYLNHCGAVDTIAAATAGGIIFSRGKLHAARSCLPPVFRGCSAAFKPPLLFAIACKANKVIYDLRQLFLGGAHPQLRQPEHHAQEVVVEIVEGLLKVRKSQNQIALFSYVLISSKKRKKILF